MERRASFPSGITLFRDDDTVCRGRPVGMPLLDVVATWDAMQKCTLLQYVWAGYDKAVGEALRFPYVKGESEMICEEDATLVLIATGDEKRPLVLQRRMSAAAAAGDSPF